MPLLPFRSLVVRALMPGAFLCVWIALAGRMVSAHENPPEERLLWQFATGVQPVVQGQWPDVTGHATARVVGAPQITNVGPAQAILFDGFTEWLRVATDRGAAALLPRREFTISAWVTLNDTHADGGIAGYGQDNGNYEKGWVLGYDKKTFTFSLATTGADDGDGRLTRLRAQTGIGLGRWHYVAATYDGVAMRLYVDGRLEGETNAQSGDVLYPEKGNLALGAYADADELHPMDGGFSEIKLYGRALSAEEIASVARRNAGLLTWRPSINETLQFVVKPYLQAGGTETMTVMAETTQPASFLVEYGERQPLRMRMMNEERKTIQGVTLTGLKPFTHYFYRVTCVDAQGHVARSDIQTLQTFPDARTAWSFGIIGDTQRNPDVTRRCAEGIFSHRPNVVIHCGDVVDDGHAKHQWVQDLFTPMASLNAHVPLQPVIGNHERNAHWYYDYFHLPAPEYYYTFTVGNAQFFMIDSNKDCGPGSEQYRWLEKELARSRATWKFAAHHHPIFSSDENDYGDHWKGRPTVPFTYGDTNVQRLVPLYEKYGVDIAWAGHVHSYERTWPILRMSVHQKKGVRYIVSGGGGGSLEQAGPQRTWFTLHLARGHHYCVAAVHDRTIQFKAYDLEGRLFDTFELTKR